MGVLCPRQKLSHDPGYPVPKGRRAPTPTSPPRGPPNDAKNPIFPILPHFSPYHRGKCVSGVSGEDGPTPWVPCPKRAVRSRPRPRPPGGPK